MNPFYDKKAIIRYLIYYLLILALCKTTSGLGFVVIPMFLIFAIAQGKTSAILFVLLTAVCVMVTGHFFVPKPLGFMIAQKSIMLLAAVVFGGMIFGRRSSGLVTPLLAIFPYLICLAVASQTGWSPFISNLKLLLFSMTFFGFMGCAVRVMNGGCHIRELRSIVLAFAIFFVLGSVLVIPIPAISMMGAAELRNNPDVISLFKGVTSHSQTLGPLIAMMGTFLFADMVFSIQRPDRLYVILLIICPYLIYKTSSRTAMGSFLLGVFFVGYLAMHSRGLIIGWRKKLVNIGGIVFFCCALAIVLIPSIRNSIVRFTLKYKGSESGLSTETILSSRQSKIDSELYHWRQRPYFGNGFQVSVDMQYAEINGIRDAISAPVEKGTWIYAVLEEGGIVGLMLFLFFVMSAELLMFRRKAYVGASMLFVMLLVNLGEFVIFSMTAMGGTLWFLVFLGVMIDYKRQNGGSAPLFARPGVLVSSSTPPIRMVTPYWR